MIRTGGRKDKKKCTAKRIAGKDTRNGPSARQTADSGDGRAAVRDIVFSVLLYRNSLWLPEQPLASRQLLD